MAIPSIRVNPRCYKREVTSYCLEKGPRYFEMAEGYVLKLALDSNDEIIGYSYVNLGRMMNAIRKGANPDQAYEEACGTYGRYDEAVKYIDPREE